MFLHSYNVLTGPYPDRSGDPYHTAFKTATAAHAGASPHMNNDARPSRGRRAAATIRSTAASTTRFGRVTMAAAAASPAANAVTFPEPSANSHASSHHAVAGTSLIGSSD
ncbi:MAG: hypothetical protein AUI11_01400 [Acidobacteria bacterium 13_2_20CM_2_66_4]|nr:MAG: hypothetical protein AUI11_01400 [Acidobacteria bacterium 13_2_20CM_2_66_4]